MLIHLKIKEDRYVFRASRIIEIAPFVKDLKNPDEYGLWVDDMLCEDPITLSREQAFGLIDKLAALSSTLDLGEVSFIED
jgi:hypothetical protein